MVKPSASSHNKTTQQSPRDYLYAGLVAFSAVAFMLFLLSSGDLMTNLTIIGVLLCLTLVGSAMRFFSARRMEQDLRDTQVQQDLDLRVLQHRVGDHDLMLLDLTGRVEKLGAEVGELRAEQAAQDQRLNAFANGIKDRLLRLVTSLARARQSAAEQKAQSQSVSPQTAAPRKKSSSRWAFRMAGGRTANDVQTKHPTAEKATVATTSASPDLPKPRARRYDDDIIISQTLVRDALKEALTAERIDMYVQPIATLPQRQMYALDISGRIRLQAGVYIPARDYRGVAAHDNQLPTIDRLVLADIARQNWPDQVALFISLTRESLCDTATVAQLVSMTRRRPELARQLVLQISQNDFTRLEKNEERIIRELQRTGIRFGLNDVQKPDLDLNRLADLSFAYLKLPVDRLMTAPNSDQGMALVHRFITRLKARNIHLIVGRVEDQDALRPLLDYPVHLAQGYLFGRPDRPVAYQVPMTPSQQKVA